MGFSTLSQSITKRTIITLLLLISIIGGFIYVTRFSSVTLSPVAEQLQMQQLATHKTRTSLSPFVSDGCSGGVSLAWTESVQTLSLLFPSFDEQYGAVETIPFEAACEAHDLAYHTGVGGYVGRLTADNELRTAILQYGIKNADEVAARANLASPEQAIFLYETIAEAVYRAVRLGGAPCTGQPYAWGYGYGGGYCADSE